MAVLMLFFIDEVIVFVNQELGEFQVKCLNDLHRIKIDNNC